MAKEEKTPTKEATAKTHTAVQSANESSLPLVAMILGILSLAMFMLFLGIPALILGIIGLKKAPANKAFSITAIVTGAISTLIMLGLIALVILGIFSAAFHDQNNWSNPSGNYYQDNGSNYPMMDHPSHEGI